MGQNASVTVLEDVTKNNRRLETFDTDVVRFTILINDKRFVPAFEDLPWTGPGDIEEMMLLFNGHYDVPSGLSTCVFC